MHLQYCVCLALSLALTGCAALSGPTLTERAARNAELYDKAQTAIVGSGETQADYESAADLYEQAARNGSAQAAYALAALYRDAQIEGEGSDDAAREAALRENAFFWMREAAVGGWPQAQYEVAVFYYSGKGVEADPAQALTWLETAAANNHVLAQRFLGALYMNGANADGRVTVTPDAKKGASWYLRAAYNDDGPSQAVMGQLYMTGKGIERDSIQAAKWNRLAAAKGETGAQQRLATLYARQKRQNNYEQAILNQQEEFSKGNLRAGYRLGRIYYYAPAPYTNARQAVKLFTETAGKVGSSALMLGVANEEGKGVPRNYALAVNWYRKAISLGQNEAYAYLGSAFLDGRGVPANEGEAVRLLQEGADKGDARSQRHLAVLYTQGKGVPYDYEQALHWTLQAARNGDVQAMYLAGTMYEKGVGTVADVAEARRFYQQAVASAGLDEFVRREDASVWKRDAQKALERLAAQEIKEAAGTGGDTTGDGTTGDGKTGEGTTGDGKTG